MALAVEIDRLIGGAPLYDDVAGSRGDAMTTMTIERVRAACRCWRARCRARPSPPAPPRSTRATDSPRWLDFVAAENSMGFHAPQELARILGESIDFARQGQLEADRSARTR